MDWFEERTDALAVAEAMGVDVEDRADIPEIKRAVVESHLGDVRADASDDYLAGVYDHVRKQVQTKQQKGRYDGISSTLAAGRVPRTNMSRHAASDDGDDTRLDALAADKAFRDKFRN